MNNAAWAQALVLLSELDWLGRMMQRTPLPFREWKKLPKDERDATLAYASEQDKNDVDLHCGFLPRNALLDPRALAPGRRIERRAVYRATILGDKLGCPQPEAVFVPGEEPRLEISFKVRPLQDECAVTADHQAYRTVITVTKDGWHADMDHA